jgi:hypothetical protein
MDDKEQTLRERAYKIWEDEGRSDGSHEDHWRRAEEQHQASEGMSGDEAVDRVTSSVEPKPEPDSDMRPSKAANAT